VRDLRVLDRYHLRVILAAINAALLLYSDLPDWGSLADDGLVQVLLTVAGY
jgi:hypothetical protein